MPGYPAPRTTDIQLPNKGKKDPRLKTSSPLEGLKKAMEGHEILKKKGIKLPENILGARG